MLRPRSPDAVRRSAIEVGARKLADGCGTCADGYFELARRNGASDEDIRRARIEAAVGLRLQGGQLGELSRRDIISLAARGIVAVGASAILGPEIRGWTTEAQATGSAGGQLAWLFGSNGSAKSTLVAINQQGGVVRRVDAISHRVMLTQNGSRIVAVDSNGGGGGSGVAVRIFDAGSGNEETSIVANELGVTSLDLDTPTPGLSGDGRYVGVLRQIMRNALASPVPLGGSRVQPVTRTLENRFELFDLLAATVSSALLVDTSEDFLPGAEVVPAVTNGSFYVITRNGLSDETMRLVVPSPVGLRVAATATNGRDGHRIPPVNLGLPMTWRVVDGGSTLVRVMGNTVQWLDLKQMTASGTLDISGMGTNGARPLGPLGSAFSPDGSSLFLSAPLTGAVRVVDVQAKTLRSSLELPGDSGGDFLRGYFQQDSIAVSPRGDRVYVLDGRTQTSQLWTLAAPELSILGSQSVTGAGAVWVGADGTLYLLVRDRVAVQTGTTPRPVTPSIASLVGFVAPDRTWY